jgi:hypothetical protein
VPKKEQSYSPHHPVIHSSKKVADEHLSAAVALRSVAFFEEHAYHSDPATHWNPLFGVLGRNATQAVLSVEQGAPCV